MAGPGIPLAPVTIYLKGKHPLLILRVDRLETLDHYSCCGGATCSDAWDSLWGAVHFVWNERQGWEVRLRQGLCAFLPCWLTIQKHKSKGLQQGKTEVKTCKGGV